MESAPFTRNISVQRVVERVVREYEDAGYPHDEIFTEPVVAQVARVAFDELIIEPSTRETRHLARMSIMAGLAKLA